MTEIWKDISGYEGLYQVSNLGNVRSVDRLVEYPDGHIQRYKGRILKPSERCNTGYYYVNLSKNSKIHDVYVHQLVGETFLNKCNDDDVIDHIDRNRHNNRLENLRYTSQRNNIFNSDRNPRPDIFLLKNGKYRVRISVFGVRKYIGQRNTYDDALELYMKYFNERQIKYKLEKERQDGNN